MQQVFIITQHNERDFLADSLDIDANNCASMRLTLGTKPEKAALQICAGAFADQRPLKFRVGESLHKFMVTGIKASANKSTIYFRRCDSEKQVCDPLPFDEFGQEWS